MEDVEDGGCIEFERMNGVNKIGKLMVVALALWAGAASAATGKSAAFPLERSGFAWWARLAWPSVAENSILT